MSLPQRLFLRAYDAYRRVSLPGRPEESSEPLEPVMGLWVSDEGSEPVLPVTVALSIKSFLACGHPYHLYCYQDYTNIPAGAVVKDANQIINREFLYKHYQPVSGYALFSDWFRWELLSQHSGWWADTDVICLKPLNIRGFFVVGFQAVGPGFVRLEDYCEIATALIKATKRRNPNIRYMRDRLRAHKFTAASVGDPHSIGGPKPFTACIREHGHATVLLPSAFNPVPYTQWQRLYQKMDADQAKLLAAAYTTHLWTGMLRQIEAPINIHPESFIAEQCRRLDVPQPEAVTG